MGTDNQPLSRYSLGGLSLAATIWQRLSACWSGQDWLAPRPREPSCWEGETTAWTLGVWWTPSWPSWTRPSTTPSRPPSVVSTPARPSPPARWRRASRVLSRRPPPSRSRPPGPSPPLKVLKTILRDSSTASPLLRGTVHPSPPTPSLRTPPHSSHPASSPLRTPTLSSAPTPSRAPAALVVWRTATSLSQPHNSQPVHHTVHQHCVVQTPPPAQTP